MKENKYREIFESVITEEAEALSQQKNHFQPDAFKEIVKTLSICKGHVLVAGMGTSRTIAARFAHLLACSGVPALFIHPADSRHGASGAVKEEDVVIGVSKGGRTEELNEFLEITSKRGATVIGFTEKPGSPLGNISDLVYKAVIPEGIDPLGMIATGSSLINGALMDAVCSAVLEETGYSKDEFAETHPGGDVGKRLEEEENESD